MVEPTPEFEMDENDENEEEDWGEWDEAENDEYDVGRMMEEVTKELTEEKAIAENMAQLEALRKNRDEIL